MKRLALLISIAMVSQSARAAELEYNRDVRPILADNCFACHGADSAARKGDLRLDNREAAIKAGAIVAGDPAKSTLMQRILTEDNSEKMPPPKIKKFLTAKQKDILKQWILEGAKYQAHWSLIAPVKPTPPNVKNASWVRNPIDRFILAQLEKEGLTPAPEADRRTLARRLSLDLIGLPPTPAEVEAFVNDKSPDWYEKYVDKLMKSPSWGEHRGRYWLDAARYADTHGIHFDNYREIWNYRDWVIKAFNQNMKFDQFTIEQLAGDLLPKATLDQKIASGFNRCNITTSEGGAIDEEYLVLYARDRTETVNQIWMGLTAGCAVCHDHKFDPITMRDFYSMSAFFNNSTQRAMDGNVSDTPPIIVVPKMEDRARWEVIAKEIASAKQKAEERKKTARVSFDSWLKESKTEEIKKKIPTNGLDFYAAFTKGEGQELDLVVKGKETKVKVENGFAWEPAHISAKGFSIKEGKAIEIPEVGDYDLKQSFSAGAWIKIPTRAQTGSIVARMDGPEAGYRGWDVWYENGKIAMHLVNNWPTDALKVVTKNPLNPANDWHHVFITYDGSVKPEGIRIYIDGALQPVDIANNNLKSTLKSKAHLTVGQRFKGDRLKAVMIQDLRVYSRSLSGPEVGNVAKISRAIAVLEKLADKRTPAEKDEIFAWWLTAMDKEYVELTEKVAAVQQEEVQIKSRGSIAHVMNERPEAPVAYVLARGEYDKRRDKVTPDVPKSLPSLATDLPRNRLGFAKWLLQPEHPLTARVTVNRFWQELFGNGIVRTSGDFGVSGELPTHPELLDWMALEFRDNGWDVQKFFKLMVTSATYRQAAITTAEKREKDPLNRLLSRGARFRMDAEMIRDYALSVSGLLSPKIGGPSVKPYQPDGVWEAVAMIGSNTRDYRRDSGESLYRRSMYTFWKRAAPPASMEILNAPNRETCAVRRERTNTPLQALVTLNDPQFVEAARNLAQKALKEGGDKTESRIDYLAKKLLSRSLTSDESKIISSAFDSLLAEYKSKPAEAQKLITFGESKPDEKLDPGMLAAWTMLANQMMNLDEVLCK